jgi:hypothetical protein
MLTEIVWSVSSDMSEDRTVILSMNALRDGGSQTVALTLGRILQQHGFRVIVLAKAGALSSTFEEKFEVTHMRWAEGEAGRKGMRQFALWAVGWGSIWKASRRFGHPRAWIASQPWQLRYSASSRRTLWRSTPRFALVHGTTAVEMPGKARAHDLRAMDGVFTTTVEAREHLAEIYGVSASYLGNLFAADQFWHGIARPDPLPCDGPRILSLSTLGSDKVAPVSGLIGYLRQSLLARAEIVGDGPLRGDLEGSGADLIASGRLTFLGSLPDPRSAILRSTIVIGAGRVVLEAGSLPRRVIVANSSGIAGPLTVDNCDEFELYNFTGRVPGSAEPTASNLASAIAAAESIEIPSLNALAERLQLVGDPTPLIRAIEA